MNIRFDAVQDKKVSWGVAKLVKAPDFDSGIRRFESFFPSHTTGRPIGLPVSFVRFEMA